MTSLILVLAESNNLLTTIPQVKTKTQDSNNSKPRLCSEVKVYLVVASLPTAISELKTLASTSKLHNLYQNTVTLKIKIDNLDLPWKTPVVTLIKQQEIKHVDYLECLMGMVESKYLNTAQKLFQLSLEKKYKRNHKIYIRFMKQYFKKLIANQS